MQSVRQQSMSRAACIAVLLLANAAVGARANEPSLIVAVDHGAVVVTEEGASFTELELSAIRAYVESGVADSPLDSHGGLRLVLRGAPLEEARAALRTADLGDRSDVDRALEGFIDSYVEGGATALVEPIEWIVGREIQRSADAPPSSIVALGSSGVLDGTVADLVAVGSHIELGPTARVTNRLVSVGSQIEIAPGARVSGSELRLTVPAEISAWTQPSSAQPEQPEPFADRLGWSVFGLLASFALGMVWIRFAPVFSARATERIGRQPWRGLAAGCLPFIAVVPGAILLILTLIGILLLPLYAASLGLLFWVGFITAAVHLGASIRPRWARWQQVLLGLVLLSALPWIPVAGGVVTFLATLVGVGAVLLTLYDRTRERRGRARQAVEPSELSPRMPEGPAPQSSS